MHKPVPSREEIALLEVFEGLPLERIFIPETRLQFESASAEIMAAAVVGFDTEARPTFVKGDVSAGPHIVQFATRHSAFIFQLNQLECQPFLNELLQSEQLLKVGFGLKSDHGQISNKLGVRPGAVLDMNDVFRQDGYGSSMGVRAAIAVTFNKRFLKSKKVTTSNWAAPHLSARQASYAANDAYAALEVLIALDRARAELPVTGLSSGMLP